MHTPGPWKIWDGNDCPQIRSEAVGSGYYSTIASVTQRDAHPVHGGEVSHEQAAANARLIAAAPALLEALVNVLAAYRDSINGPEVDAARKAVSLARGI